MTRGSSPDRLGMEVLQDGGSTEACCKVWNAAPASGDEVNLIDFLVRVVRGLVRVE